MGKAERDRTVEYRIDEDDPRDFSELTRCVARILIESDKRHAQNDRRSGRRAA